MTELEGPDTCPECGADLDPEWAEPHRFDCSLDPDVDLPVDDRR